eukprot:5619337-Amphidinium_carterae.1
MVVLGHTLMGGLIPQSLLGGNEQANKCVVAKASECPTCQHGTGGVVDSKIAPMLGLVSCRSGLG